MGAIYCSIFFLICYDVVLSFNYYMDPSDVIQEKVHNFGYSLVLQHNRLLVGSPKTDIANNTRDFKGNVYACENFTNCKSLIGFGQKNNLLGLSLDGGTSRDSNAIICEPRFIESDGDNLFPVGRCFYYRNNAVSEIINPFKSIDNVIKNDKGTSHYYAGMSEAGLSVKRIKDQLTILGAPGFDNWKGSLVEYSKQSNSRIFSAGSNIYDYAGYDVSFVRLNRVSVVWYVIGAPRANNLLGRVLVVQSPEYFKSNMNLFVSFKGEQFGEYYGSSLGTADLNGDGFEDILVGSPTYRLNKYDEGKVTIYISNVINGIFSINLQERIFGDVEGGKFGTTIANLGKLLPDDKMDSVAISAPFENNGKGAVYIYRRIGRNLKLHQKILPSTNQNSRGFGISITKALDVDANQFNDFAVGAYQSSQIYIVKARPIVKIMLYNIKSSVDKILIGKTKSFSVEFCVSFQSESSPVKLLPGVNIDVVEEFRKVIIDTPKEIVDITVQCFKRNVQNRPFSVDDITPIEIKISASLPYRDTNCSTCPIEHPNSKAVETLIIPISPDCGPDNICTPEYEITFDKKVFLVGTTNTLMFEVGVRNIGEPAYDCFMTVSLPEDINIAQTNCDQSSSSGINSLKCGLGNPLKTNTMETLKIDFDVSNLDVSRKDLCFRTEISSYNNVRKEENYLCVPLEYKREIVIKGISVPSTLVYDADREVFNNLTHEFLITNSGPSAYKDFSIKLLVPYFPDAIIIEGKEEYILDIYDPIVFVDNKPKHHICSVVNDYKTLSSKSDNSKGPPRVARSVLESPEQYSISNRAILDNISVDNAFELKETNNIEIICSVDKLQNSMVLKIPVQFSMPRMQMLYENELQSKNLIIWGTSGFIAIDQKEFEGIAITILDYSTSGLKTWQYALIIAFATIIGIAVLVAIIYTLYKFGFFSRPLKDKLDTMEMKLVDENKGGNSVDQLENINISENTSNTNLENNSVQHTTA